MSLLSYKLAPCWCLWESYDSLSHPRLLALPCTCPTEMTKPKICKAVPNRKQAYKKEHPLIRWPIHDVPFGRISFYTGPETIICS